MPLSLIRMKARGCNVSLSDNKGFTLPGNIGELGDDMGFEVLLVMQVAHAASLTSILPVTAAVIRAARFSRRRSMLRSVSA